MNVIETIADLETIRKAWNTETIAFVPTMGALHGGHLSLFEKAKQLGTKVIVSIYVNPLQFGPTEDFTQYPRTREADLALCAQYEIDAVFYPFHTALHPDGYDTITKVVPPTALVNQLCGLSRPGHFTGVATIVLKLFELVQPHYAVFGEKDGQQLAVIQRMVADLNVPVTIIPATTVRGVDGLALSSRNQYLTTESDLRQARLLSRLLICVQSLYEQGIQTTTEALSLAKDQVLDETLYPDFDLEYLSAVHRETFMPVEILDEESLILVAARVGSVRLIDNVLVSQPLRLEPTLVGLTNAL